MQGTIRKSSGGQVRWPPVRSRTGRAAPFSDGGGEQEQEQGHNEQLQQRRAHHQQERSAGAMAVANGRSLISVPYFICNCFIPWLYD